MGWQRMSAPNQLVLKKLLQNQSGRFVMSTTQMFLDIFFLAFFSLLYSSCIEDLPPYTLKTKGVLSNSVFPSSFRIQPQLKQRKSCFNILIHKYHPSLSHSSLYFALQVQFGCQVPLGSTFLPTPIHTIIVPCWIFHLCKYLPFSSVFCFFFSASF